MSERRGGRRENPRESFRGGDRVVRMPAFGEERREDRGSSRPAGWTRDKPAPKPAGVPRRAAEQLKPRELTTADLTMKPTDPMLAYRSREKEFKAARKWGQMKLLLSELDFFTRFWDSKKVPAPICVYAGAAPGTHTAALAKLLPAVTFELYDPRDFSPLLVEGPRMHLHSQYFTDDDAKRWANRDDVFFMSDIRTTGPKPAEDKALRELESRGTPFTEREVVDRAREIIEAEVAENMESQQRWTLIMQPAQALLKFRLPYVNKAEDEKPFRYFKGVVVYQVFEGQSSTETRLVPVREGGRFVLADWSPREYESLAFFHNAVRREVFVYENPFTRTADPIDPPELMNDYDSVATALILKSYLIRAGRPAPTQEEVVKLYRFLAKALGGTLVSRHQKWLRNFEKFADKSTRLRTGEIFLGLADPLPAAEDPRRRGLRTERSERGDAARKPAPLKVLTGASAGSGRLPPLGNVRLLPGAGAGPACGDVAVPEPRFGAIGPAVLPAPEDGPAGAFLPFPRLGLTFRPRTGRLPGTLAERPPAQRTPVYLGDPPFALGEALPPAFAAAKSPAAAPKLSRAERMVEAFRAAPAKDGDATPGFRPVETKPIRLPSAKAPATPEGVEAALREGDDKGLSIAALKDFAQSRGPLPAGSSKFKKAEWISFALSLLAPR